MITIKIDDVEKNIDLRHQRNNWWWFNIIETGPDGLGHPVAQHSLPIWFFKEGPGSRVTTSGHSYQYISR